MNHRRKRVLWALVGLNAALFAFGNGRPALAEQQVPVNGQCALCVGSGGEAVWCCVKRNCVQEACNCAFATNCS